MRFILFVDIRNQLGCFLHLSHNLVKEFFIFLIQMLFLGKIKTGIALRLNAFSIQSLAQLLKHQVHGHAVSHQMMDIHQKIKPICLYQGKTA